MKMIQREDSKRGFLIQKRGFFESFERKK